MNPLNTPQITPVSTTQKPQDGKELTPTSNPSIPTPSAPTLVPKMAGAAAASPGPENRSETTPGAVSPNPENRQAPTAPQSSSPAPVTRPSPVSATPSLQVEIGKAPTETQRAPVPTAPTAPLVPRESGASVTTTKANLTDDKMSAIHVSLKAQTNASVPSSAGSSQAVKTPVQATPKEVAQAPANSMSERAQMLIKNKDWSAVLKEFPPESREAGIARIKIKQEEEEKKREARVAEKEKEKADKKRLAELEERFSRPKMKKGEYVQKLKELQFEKLSDAEAKIAYDLLQSRLEKHSLQRNAPIKALFTKDEFEALEKAAKALKIEKSRLVRKLCFTGEASVEVLDKLEELRLELNRIGNNINQIAHVLQLKKTTFTDDIKHHLDKELKDLREQIAKLERRVAR